MMDKEFLNKKDNTRLSTLKNMVAKIDESKYDNRFSDFDQKVEVITWDEVMEYIDWLANEIEKRGKHYIGVYGLPRAGIILAVLLSYRMGLPLLADPCKDCLVMDDDSSTGCTLFPYVGKCDIALMYKNPDCVVEPEYLYKTYGSTYKEFVWNLKNKSDL